jgi:hypothetical protein
MLLGIRNAEQREDMKVFYSWQNRPAKTRFGGLLGF